MARKVEVDQKEGMVLKRIHGDSKVSTFFLNFQSNSNSEMIQFDGHIFQMGWFNYLGFVWGSVTGCFTWG